MREIRFRGKSLNTGEFVFGYYFSNGKGHHFIVTENTNFKYKVKEKLQLVQTTFNEIIFVDPRTIGQYTGLEDKKGREIYEGDIVNAKYVYIEEKPVYDGETGEFIGIKDEEKEIKKTFVVKWHLGAFNLIPDKAIHWEFETIGNIYENPELLELDNAV